MKYVTNERLLTVCRHPPWAAGIDDQSWMIPSQYSSQGIDTRFADTVRSLRPAILAFKPLVGGVLGLSVESLLFMQGYDGLLGILASMLQDLLRSWLSSGNAFG